MHFNIPTTFFFFFLDDKQLPGYITFFWLLLSGLRNFIILYTLLASRIRSSAWSSKLGHIVGWRPTLFSTTPLANSIATQTSTSAFLGQHFYNIWLSSASFWISISRLVNTLHGFLLNWQEVLCSSGPFLNHLYVQHSTSTIRKVSCHIGSLSGVAKLYCHWSSAHWSGLRICNNTADPSYMHFNNPPALFLVKKPADIWLSGFLLSLFLEVPGGSGRERLVHHQRSRYVLWP